MVLLCSAGFLLLINYFPEEELSSLRCHRVMVPLACRRSREARLILTCSLKILSKMHSTHELELFPGHSVTQMLFKEVKNAAELRQSAVAGKINGALINPTMVRYLLSDLATFESDFLYVFSFANDSMILSTKPMVIRSCLYSCLHLLYQM